MNKPSWVQVLKVIKRHETRLIGAAGAALFGLAAVFLLFVMPQAANSRMIQDELDLALQQKKLIEKRPVPVKVQPQDIQSAVEQVPTADETARLLMALRSLEKETGVTLSSVTFGDVASQTTQEAAIFGALASPHPSSSPAAAPTPAPKTTSGTGTSTPLFQEDKITLIMSGNYSQIMNYLDKLYEQKRIIAIKEWTLTPGVKAETDSVSNSLLPSGSSSLPSDDLKVQANLTLAVYTAQQYNGKFEHLPPLTVEPGANRKEPLWNDEMMYELAKPAQP